MKKFIPSAVLLFTSISAWAQSTHGHILTAAQFNSVHSGKPNAADLADSSPLTKGDAPSGFTQSEEGSIAKSKQSGVSDRISVKQFGAKGDGVSDDSLPLQEALIAAKGKTLYVPAGVYRLATRSPQVFSNTTIVGDGVGRTILIQPNYYRYNRPGVAYNKAAVVDWDGLWMDVGTQNVTIDSIEIRGPFYQTSAAGYAAHPVQNWPANNGIQVRGRDYQWRHGLSPIGESSNIRIRNVHIEGFAEDGIQLDNVTNAWVEDSILTRQGRGGVRGYGLQHGHITGNTISYLSPGDYLNRRTDPSGNLIGGNRMYGVTFTRVYGGDLTDYRPSMWDSASYNKISFVPYWKGLDTHGGVNIDFIGNRVEESNIGIGVDKGGYTIAQGIAPPANIKIIGNTLIRTMPDNPNEGNDGYAGAALQIFANDETDQQVGRNIVVSDNTMLGWGDATKYGAVVYSDWIGVQHRNNMIGNSRRSAVCLRGRWEGSLSGDVIDDVRPSTAKVQIGIDNESAHAQGRIGDTTFINRQPTTLTGIYLATPSRAVARSTGVTGLGFSVSSGHRFLNRGPGTITPFANVTRHQDR